ncbi:MAG: HlyD family secretion protein [Bacteroidales bacterium]|jgi:HlyD family secretion protein|nr:HlyD family secretion protein [Bacteroidales bacterium]
MKYETPDKIELRSEEIQEILGKPPRWLVRYGIALIFIIVLGLFAGSYFFKYPDILQASITVTTENLPAGVVARANGRIDSVFVSEQQSVHVGDLLACIQNPARTEDVLFVEKYLTDKKTDALNRDFASFFHPNTLSLGDLAPAFLAMLKACEEYDYFIKANYHREKIRTIEKQVQVQKSIVKKEQQQLVIGEKQLSGVAKLFSIDSGLYAKSMLSRTEYEQSRNTYLQQIQNYEQSKLNIDNLQLSILQSEQSIFDLTQQRAEQEKNLLFTLTSSREQLLSQIKAWKENYILVAPRDGVVTFTKYRQKNQNVVSGEVVVTIVPDGDTHIIGKIILPAQGAGKVKTGQIVNVKLDNYPYMEYGMLRVPITGVSLVPVDMGDGKKANLLEVEFPEKLVTNYGKKLDFSQEMTGTAEIITEDTRLLDKFINPVKAVLKR